MELHWESLNALEFNNFVIPEYQLTSFKTLSGVTCYSNTFPSPRARQMSKMYYGAARTTVDDGCGDGTLTSTPKGLLLGAGIADKSFRSQRITAL